MDPMGKIHVIHALEDGRPKADIAREFGVNSRTITSIYSQKDSIIKKYAQKYNALKVRYINLDQTLLDWIALQMKNGKNIKETELRNKAQELISNQSNEQFSCIDDWLQDFQKRHNIEKFVSKIDCSSKAQKEWNKFANGIDGQDVYIIEMCGLYHSYSFNEFLDNEKPRDYVSLLFIVNCVGSDKQQLIVAGQDEVNKNCVRSLPVNYFRGEKSLINYNIIDTILKQWDENLKLQNRHIFLLVGEGILNQSMKFENIELINSSKMDYVTKCTQKIIESFKYHYRRALITRKLIHNQNPCFFEYLDYLHLMGAAWQSISPSFFNMLFFPPKQGSLYFNTDNYNSNTWHIMQTSENDSKENFLEEYVSCDKHLEPLDNTEQTTDMENVNETLLKNDCAESPSSIQAFQAMKRLYSYLQGENGRGTVMQAARKLEDHLENGALLEIHDVYASMNDTE